MSKQTKSLPVAKQCFPKFKTQISALIFRIYSNRLLSVNGASFSAEVLQNRLKVCVLHKFGQSCCFFVVKEPPKNAMVCLMIWEQKMSLRVNCIPSDRVGVSK